MPHAWSFCSRCLRLTEGEFSSGWRDACSLQTWSAFSRKEKQTAWGLCNGASRGFSGTKDCHRMLPLTASQGLDISGMHEFQATNGKMLHVI